MELRSCEDDVQNRRDDLERELPARPGFAEEDEDHDSLGDGSHNGNEEGAEEEVGEECMVVDEDAVEDEGYVEPEFCEDVEGSCEGCQTMMLS